MERSPVLGAGLRLRRASAASLAAAAVAVLVLRAAGPSAAAFDDPIDVTRAALEQWVETRRLISQEKRDWTEGREVLRARIELLQREIEDMRAKVTEAEGNVVETDRKRDELVQENEALRTATQSLARLVSGLENRTRALLPRLPPPIRERVKVLSQRIPTDSATTEASLSERFQNVVGILNEVDKFNRDVTLSLEVRERTEGGAIEVTAMYLGVGQAFYASANGEAAGMGRSTVDGWEWVPVDDAAPSILAAIAVQRNEQPAAFVQIPLHVE